MRFLAAWFGDLVTYWPNLVGLVFVVTLTVFAIQQIQLKAKAPK